MFKTKNQFWPRYWQQLSVMIGAGLTIEVALKSLQSSVEKNNKYDLVAFKRIIGLVSRGQSLSTAFMKANCISPSDFTLLQIAEKSGKLSAGLTLIADRRIDWLMKVDTLKANLLLPKGLLLVGALAGMFVRMASAGEPFSEALYSVLSTLIVAWLFISLTVWLIKCDGLTWLSLGWRLPFLKERWLVYQLLFEQAFYRLLIWQINAGIAPDKALETSKDLLHASDYKRKVTLASGDASKGEAMDLLLNKNGLVLSASLKQVLRTSIQIGSWDKAIDHHLKLQRQVLLLKSDDFFKWLPRFYYFLTLLVISKFMFV